MFFYPPRKAIGNSAVEHVTAACNHVDVVSVFLATHEERLYVLGEQQVPCAPPDFLWDLVASVNFMRLSLRKGAHVVLSSAAWQEIRVRFGRDDKFVWGPVCWHGRGARRIKTAGPSTSLRSGRDDKSVWGPRATSANGIYAFATFTPVVPRNCHPDRSLAKRRDLLSLYFFIALSWCIYHSINPNLRAPKAITNVSIGYELFQIQLAPAMEAESAKQILEGIRLVFSVRP